MTDISIKQKQNYSKNCLEQEDQSLFVTQTSLRDSQQRQSQLFNDPLRNIKYHLAVTQALKTIQKEIKQLPSHGILKFSLKQRAPVSCFEQIRVTQMRQALNICLQRAVSDEQVFLSQLFKGEKSQNTSLYLAKSHFCLQFQNILQECCEELISQHPQKIVYAYMRMSWQTSIVNRMLQIYDSAFKNMQKYSSVSELKYCYLECANSDEEIKQDFLSAEKTKLNTQIILINQDYISSNSELIQLLTKSQLNLAVKGKLLSLFSQNQKQLKNKELQTQKWRNYAQQMKGVIDNQIQMIEYQQCQNQQLKWQLNQTEARIRYLQTNCQQLEKQFTKIQKQLKLASSAKTETVQNYYINPNFQKNQQQQKMLIELIQLESDLFLSKNQINYMTQAILQIFKATHSALDQLSISRKFIKTLDSSLAKIVSELKSFENVDLDQFLNLKQECFSTVQSEYLTATDLKKSSISSFSQMDQTKQIRIQDGWNDEQIIQQYRQDQ